MTDKNAFGTLENSDDMQPYGCCEVATLVLDRQLHISSYTPSIQKFMSLNHSDSDRALTNIALKISDDDLIRDCQQVLDQGSPMTRKIHSDTDTDLVRCILPCQSVGRHITGVIVNYMDPAGCRHTLQALKEKQEHLRAILDTAVDAIIGIDTYGIIDEFNPAAERMFGYPACELLGTNTKALMPVPHRDHHDDYLARHRETGEAKIIGTGREVSARRKDGSEFPVHLSVSEVDHCQHYMAFIHDLSPRKALENELLSITEQAQRDFGQNLHDDIGQEMIALTLKAETLQERLLRSGQREGTLAKSLVAGLDRIHGKIRMLARGLIPVPVDAKGLALALQELTSEVSRTYDIICIFSSEDTVTVTNPSVANHLYRIAQEAINNAIQHGQARHIRVSLHMQGNDLNLKIEDSGTGIAGNAAGKPGMGLRIMQHRCGIIGGTLKIGPGKPHGTLVACRVPMLDGNA